MTLGPYKNGAIHVRIKRPQVLQLHLTYIRSTCHYPLSLTTTAR